MCIYFGAPLADVDPGDVCLPSNTSKVFGSTYWLVSGTHHQQHAKAGSSLDLFSGLRSLIECCECMPSSVPPYGADRENSHTTGQLGRPKGWAREGKRTRLGRGIHCTSPISARGQIGLSFVGFVCDGRRGRTRRIRQSIVWGERPNVLLLNSHIAGEIAVAGIKPGPITHQAHEAIPVRSG